MRTIPSARVAVLLAGFLAVSASGCSVFNPAPPAYNSIEVVRERLDSSTFQAADMPDYVPPLWWMTMYLPNRLLDVLDIVNVSIGAGPGEALQVRLTRVGNLAFLNHRTWRLGLRGRSGGIYEEGFFREWHCSLWGAEDPAAGRVPVWATTNLRPFERPLRGGVPAVREVPPNDFDIGAQVHFLLGAEASVSPYEIFDLIVGLVGVDPADDDFGIREYPLHEYTPQGEIINILAQAIDGMNEADLRQVLSYEIADNSWIYRGGSFRRLLEGSGGSGPTPNAGVGPRDDFLLIGDERLEPDNYRDPSTGHFEMEIRCESATLRWGVPAQFVYTLALFNRVIQRQQFFRVTLRIEETQWRVHEFRELSMVGEN